MPIELNSSDQQTFSEGESSEKGMSINQNVSFFRRKVAGMSYRLVIGIVSVALLAMVPSGAWHALQSMAYEPSNWRAIASDSSAVSETPVDQHLLISWASEASEEIEVEQASLLGQKLTQLVAEEGWPWFPRLEEYPSSSIRADQAETPVCLVAYLSPKLANRPAFSQEVVDRVRHLATEECGIPVSALHISGQFVEQATMYEQSWWLLSRMTPLAMLLSMLLVHRVTRDEKITALLMLIATSAAAMSLAVVYYGGLLISANSVNNIFCVLPLLVFGVVLSTASYLLRHYRQAIVETGRLTAASQCFALSWRPTLFGLLCLSIGLVSLVACDLVAVQQFGLFATISLALGVVLLLMLFPASMDFLVSKGVFYDAEKQSAANKNPLFDFLGNWVTRTRSLNSVGLLSAGCLGLSLFVAIGIGSFQAPTSGELLISPTSQAGCDLAWFEEQFGSIDPVAMTVSMEPTSASFGLSQSLQMSLLITLITIACLAIARWNRAMAGFVVLLPSLAAVTIVFGITGWTQQSIGLGLLLSIGAAIGIALTGTLHYLNWFEAINLQLTDRRAAAKESFANAAPAMFESSLLLIVGLAPLAFSSILPLQQFGLFLLLVSAVGLAMNLTLLPMLVAGNVGSCFEAIDLESQETLLEESAAHLPVPVLLEEEAAPISLAVVLDSTQSEDEASEEVFDKESYEERLDHALDALSTAIDDIETSDETTDDSPATEGPALVRFEPTARSYAPKEPLSDENETLRKRLHDLRRKA